MDINLEDFRSRDNLWRLTKIALDFFHTHLPFWEMEPREGITTGAPARVLAKGDQILAVQLPRGGVITLQLAPGSYTLAWFNPRTGGPLQSTKTLSVSAQTPASLGPPPADPDKDWIALLRRMQ
jgi:hypothetical protein